MVGNEPPEVDVEPLPITIFGRQYTYDLSGNVQTIRNSVTSETMRYGYDHRQRLGSACTWTGSGCSSKAGSFNETYTYNQIGNLTTKAGVTYTYSPTKPHQVISAGTNTYTYDANGNLLTGAGRIFTWNVENQPTQISLGVQGVGESYTYDGENQRVTKVDLSQPVTTIYIGGLVEYIGTTVVSHYDGIASRTTTGTPSAANLGVLLYHHSDHLGSVSATSAIDGTLVETQEFTPWGEVRAGKGLIASTELNYTGQRKDAVTGLLFYNARYYDPALARFVSADSIVPGRIEGREDTSAQVGLDARAALRPLTVDFHETDVLKGVSDEHALLLEKGFWFQLDEEVKQESPTKTAWGPRDPQALNRYAYALNNPVRYADPSGHCAPACTLPAAAACGPGVFFCAAGMIIIGVGFVLYESYQNYKFIKAYQSRHNPEDQELARRPGWKKLSKEQRQWAHRQMEGRKEGKKTPDDVLDDILAEAFKQNTKNPRRGRNGKGGEGRDRGR